MLCDLVSPQLFLKLALSPSGLPLSQEELTGSLAEMRSSTWELLRHILYIVPAGTLYGSAALLSVHHELDTDLV